MTPEVKLSDVIPRDPVPMHLWGADHWSTFAYLETRVVDQKGVPKIDQMRCDSKRHPQHSHMHNRGMSDGQYPTRLNEGRELPDHDDWDCVDDAKAAGLVEILGTGLHPMWKLTGRGREIANELRAWKALGGQFKAFEPQPSETTPHG